MPVDGFFEWKAIKGQKARRPYAIAMKEGAPFGIAGLWENWKEPATGEWIRTFAVVTTEANEMVAEIHDRMPVILAPGDYARWLSDEPDPCDLMCPFPAGLGSGRLTNAPRPAPRAASPSLKSPWPAVRRLWPCRQRDPRSRLPTSLDSIPDTIGTLRRSADPKPLCFQHIFRKDRIIPLPR